MRFQKVRVYKVAISPKYDEYQGGLASIAYKSFYKKTESEANVNEVLAQELRKPAI